MNRGDLCDTRTMLAGRTTGTALLLLGLAACSTSAAGPPVIEIAAIDGTLEELYRSFCFDAGGQPDWDGMRSLFADGASFVAPVREGDTPRAVGADEFLRDFRAWIAGSEIGGTGRHERIVRTRIDLFGEIAHAYVTFEGRVPASGKVVTRGLDSIQLVKDRERWLVASFSTQYESEDAPLPARFER